MQPFKRLVVVLSMLVGLVVFGGDLAAAVAPQASATQTVTGCTPGEKQVAKGVIDVLGYACILANADLPDSSAVATVCQMEADAAPAVKKIVDDYKAKRLAFAHAQVSAIKCPEAPKAAVVPDAGAK